jgi:hypothetical protein
MERSQSIYIGMSSRQFERSLKAPKAMVISPVWLANKNHYTGENVSNTL